MYSYVISFASSNSLVSIGSVIESVCKDVAALPARIRNPEPRDPAIINYLNLCAPCVVVVGMCLSGAFSKGAEALFETTLAKEKYPQSLNPRSLSHWIFFLHFSSHH